MHYFLNTFLTLRGTYNINSQNSAQLQVARDSIFADILRNWRTSNFDTFSIEYGCSDRFENSRISSTQIGQLQVSRQ